MTKILVLTPGFPPQRGGVATVAYRVAEAVRRLGHEVHVLTPPLHSDINREDQIEFESDVHRPSVLRPLGGGFYRGWQHEIPRMLIQNADIVHVHNFHSGFSLQAIRASVREKKPVIVTPHYHGRGHRLLTRAMFRPYQQLFARALMDTKALTAVSETERNALVRDFPRGPPVHVIPNAVERVTAPAQARGDYYLYVGAMKAYKRVDLVIRAFEEVARQRASTRLVLVGRGPQKTALIQLVDDLQLSDRVDWIEEVDECKLRALMASARALLLLSEAEAYGLVVAESLAAATPVIIRDASALSEFRGIPGCHAIRDPDPATVGRLMLSDLTPVDLRTTNKILTWNQVGHRYAELFASVLRRTGD